MGYFSQLADTASPPTGFVDTDGVSVLADDYNLIRVQVPAGAGGKIALSIAVYVASWSIGTVQIGFRGIIYTDNAAYPDAFVRMTTLYNTPAIVTPQWVNLDLQGAAYTLPADGTWIWFGFWSGDTDVSIYHYLTSADGTHKYTTSAWPNGWGTNNEPAATFPLGASDSGYSKPYLLYYQDTVGIGVFGYKM